MQKQHPESYVSLKKPTSSGLGQLLRVGSTGFRVRLTGFRALGQFRALGLGFRGLGVQGLHIVSIVVPSWGYLLGSFKIELVKPTTKKGTTRETTGRV